MSIIDSTYFIGELSLPNNSVINAELTNSISRVEKDVLRKLLGDALYSDYVANSSDERWAKLVEGYTYEYDGYTIMWNGLQNTDKVSLLAYFTYEYVLRYRDNVFADTGVNKQLSDKSKTVSVNSKMCIAQNKGVDLYGDINDVVYKPTAYNFMRFGGYTFNDWIFTPIEKINPLGI